VLAATPYPPMNRTADSIDGYVGDSLFPSNWHAHCAPPNVDAMLAHAGIASPRSGAGPGRFPFTMADIGSGDCAGLILNAAAHPEGQFIGIDGNPGHIARGTAIVADSGLTNIELHGQYFVEAIQLQPPANADYIQCQGVLAWISEVNREHVFDLIDHMLRPGGVVVFGYNSLPGWTEMMPFQAMVHAISVTVQGTPQHRFEVALGILRASNLLPEPSFDRIEHLRTRLPANYFVHEYLQAYWRPLWSGDVLEAAARRDLHLVAQAKPGRLRPDFALKAAWRETLALLPSAAARECAVDILTRNWFRTDIFVKAPPRLLSPEAQTAIRDTGWWMATQPIDSMTFEARTAAGVITFDNAAAHAIVEALASGPKRMADIADFCRADLFNALDALFMAGQVCPVDSPSDAPLAGRTHSALVQHGAASIGGAASNFGAIARRNLMLADLCDGPLDPAMFTMAANMTESEKIRRNLPHVR